MTIPVFFAGPTFVNSLTLRFYMDGALHRHPDAELIALPWFGGGRVESSVDHFERKIGAKLLPGAPRVVVGHSQGGIVVANYALRHPRDVKHIVTVGTPFHGAWLSQMLSFTPAAKDLTEGSPHLTSLLKRITKLNGRVTNIFCPNERVMDGASCYLPGARNILVGTPHRVEAFIGLHPKLVLSEVVYTDHRVDHLNEMMVPELRRIIWRIVDEASEANGFEPNGVPDTDLSDANPLLRRILG